VIEIYTAGASDIRVYQFGYKIGIEFYILRSRQETFVESSNRLYNTLRSCFRNQTLHLWDL